MINFSSRTTIATCLGVLLLVAGCDSSKVADTAYDDEALRLNTQTVVDELELSGAQHELVRSIGERSSWSVAAELHESLSPEQRTVLTEKRTRPWQAVETAGDRQNRSKIRQERRRSMAGQRMDAVLSEEQRGQIISARQDLRDKLQALKQARGDGELTNSQLREEIAALRQTHRSLVAEILTDEQRDRIKDRHGRDRRRATVGDRLDEMTQALGLTEDQLLQIDEIQADARDLAQVDASEPRGKRVRIEERRRIFSEVLTTEQQEIVMLHKMITGQKSRRMRARMHKLERFNNRVQ